MSTLRALYPCHRNFCHSSSLLQQLQIHNHPEHSASMVTIMCKAWGFTGQLSSLSRVWLFVTPWTAACQASLSITNSWSLLKLMSVKVVMPSNHLILCHPFSSCPQSSPASGSFSKSWLFTSGGQNIRALSSASVVPMNIRVDFL